MERIEEILDGTLEDPNIVDVEAAYAIVAEFEQPAATIIKHTNPCGTGIGSNILDAYTMYKAAVENMSVNFTQIFIMVK